ncbi:hypothetical protein TGPRC2_290570 [Toxoplasma gondii TgCatPRC2]|uniref:Uncharacterized protein n=3 Tax=Toxoplasma gondii TaxID=5811 RepID=A0A151HJV8_TOXGO|nr:hypothetical protein TGME49_290570 [Toxoplasma gondii ME49]EPT28021.1 hypothetical protein TGME49_290570 [Toxoplasma gondii ME49]KYF45047.1 hypothetical protein TGARI_290570 [Toxoplasma gondii ARI]KYK69639.1 hypothetical protein TGPRC2_290570 [Toxoplasma gondii TgCatPRC2]|eukprot:XP_018636434.1 hypothetical protein TGME49_290570 [Toxoplasma gondii ME49]
MLPPSNSASGAPPPGYADRSMHLLNATGAHISVILETVEKQLRGLSTDLLPSKETRSETTRRSSSQAGAVESATEGASEGQAFAENLEFVKKYHSTCCSLNRLLHAEVEKMERLREAVCGDSLYNAALQVENLEMLNAEKARLKELKKRLQNEQPPKTYKDLHK